MGGLFHSYCFHSVRFSALESGKNARWERVGAIKPPSLGKSLDRVVKQGSEAKRGEMLGVGCRTETESCVVFVLSWFCLGSGDVLV